MTYERYKSWILNNYPALGSGPFIDLLAGSAAGGTSVLCTYPLDLARTKLAYQVVISFEHLKLWNRLEGTFNTCTYAGIIERPLLSTSLFLFVHI